MRRRILVAFVMLVVVAGCGGKKSNSQGTTPVDKWANNLCAAFSTWSNSVASAAASLKGNVNQSSLKSASGQVTKATGELRSDLKGLGEPKTQSGKKAKKTIDTLADQLKADVDTIEKAVGDVNGTSGVAQAASTLSATFATVANQVKTAFTTLQQIDTKGELEKAFKNADSCQTFSSQGG